jgi:hypothetical protein
MTWFALRTRAALGLSPTMVPVSLYVPLGFVLGPHVLNVLSYDVLAHLDGVVSVALATLGVFVGIALARQARTSGRLIAAASVESAMTILVVSSAIAVLLLQWQVPISAEPWLIALVLGTAAAASSAGAAEAGFALSDRLALTVADLDDLVPILVGAIALSLAADGARQGLGVALAQTAGIGIVIGLIGWLLFERASGPGDRAVYVLGTLAMLGGAAAYVKYSPMLTGLVAGAVWRLAPSRADEIIGADLRKFHHPLLVLLLIDAGAQIGPFAEAIWLFAPFVVFRLTGKIVGGWAAAHLAPELAADALGAYLFPPGVIGLAVALNFQQVAPSAGAVIVSAVAAGAVAFELIATLAAQRPERTA